MNKLMNTLYFKGRGALVSLKATLKDERGDTNIVAIIIILAIVIALAIVFRDAIMKLFSKIWGDLFKDVDTSLTNYENMPAGGETPAGA